MSSPSVGSSSTSNRASIAITSARWSCATMPFDRCLTLRSRPILVFARKLSALARSNRGCTPATNSSACETFIHRGNTATSAMKHTARMSRSRSAQGLRPSTFSSPSYEVRPRIALRAVVFPAPLGPIIPRMRPSSTRKSTPSSATVVPKTLRRPRASMHAIASLFLLFSFCLSLPTCAIFQELFRLQSEPLNRPVHSGPLLSEKLLPFAFQQQTARAGVDKHAETASGLNKSPVHQLLIALQDRERIEPIVRCDGAHRGQGITFPQHAV